MDSRTIAGVHFSVRELRVWEGREASVGERGHLGLFRADSSYGRPAGH